ncbi:malonyl-[acyl-carrier protein] O-methyltransferase-like [Lineus longissimus]|uniref:malonyl-[acyl-carrier protein] O-methyltransferase-like n=1 Tax=Lineus longissimus TaxID=88925 RepID=UPI002B4ED141
MLNTIMACQDHYANIAADYDKMLTFRDQFADELVEVLTKYGRLSNDQDFVDVACGTGWIQRILFERGYHFKTSTSVDPSPHMLQVVKQRVPNAECINLDGLEFSRLKKTYDALIINQSFHHLPLETLEETWRNIRSQLRRGGKVIITFGDGGFFSQDVAKRLKSTGEYSSFDYSASVRICESVLQKCGYKFTPDSPVERTYKVKVSREQYGYMLRRRYMSALGAISDEDIEKEVAALPDPVEFPYKWTIVVAE